MADNLHNIVKQRHRQTGYVLHNAVCGGKIALNTKVHVIG
jgi:hypothetical protein